jgi:hypothetical protein
LNSHRSPEAYSADRALVFSIIERVKSADDRAALRASWALQFQEGPRNHRRWESELAALVRSLRAEGRLGAAADGGLLAERGANRGAP